MYMIMEMDLSTDDDTRDWSKLKKSNAPPTRFISSDSPRVCVCVRVKVCSHKAPLMLMLTLCVNRLIENPIWKTTLTLRSVRTAITGLPQFLLISLLIPKMPNVPNFSGTIHNYTGSLLFMSNESKITNGRVSVGVAVSANKNIIYLNK